MMRFLKNALLWLPKTLWKKWFWSAKLTQKMNILFMTYQFWKGFQGARRKLRTTDRRRNVIDV